MRAWKPALLAGALATAAVAGSGTALAHEKGECQFAQGRADINGHACVEQEGEGYTVSAHDVAADNAKVWITWHTRSGAQKSLDDTANSEGATTRTFGGEVVKFRICEHQPWNPLGDRCMPWKHI